MIITISGKPAAGKDTTADLLAKKLKGFKLIKATLREFAKRFGVDVIKFEKDFASKDYTWDKKLDEWQKEEVRKYPNVILVSWLSAINVPDADLKIFITAEFEERVRRLAKREGISIEKAREYLKERDRITRERIKKIYGVDIWDKKFYDVVIDTTNMEPPEVVRIILREMKERGIKID